MQIFLPYPCIHRSLSILDAKRLNKQRVEALQIAEIIFQVKWNPITQEYVPFLGEKRAWKNHPAVKMMEKYPMNLLSYIYHSCLVSIQKETIKIPLEEQSVYIKLEALLKYLNYTIYNAIIYTVIDFGEEFHFRHKVALYYKLPWYYSRQFSKNESIQVKNWINLNRPLSTKDIYIWPQ